ncbi:MAG: polysaccharide biosynthesis protein, partial [Lachnospiraceae bacterium]|nr:polysaccharide biosynthesis protein [Lachnospiraceae bacterium]
IFASSLVTGMDSSLNYANIIKNLFYALFTAPIINIYYPRITANISLNDYDKIREELSEVIAFMLMLLVPSTIFCLFYSEEMVKFLFFRGAFNLESLHTTSAAFRMYSIGIVSICLREVLVRCYYSFNKTKEVIMNNIFSVAANIILNAVLIRYMKQTGLALATSLSAIIILPFWIKGVVDENVLSIKSVFFQFFRYTMFSVPIIVEMMVMKMVFVFPDEVLWQIVFFGKVIILAVILYIPAIYMTLIKDKRRIKK